jgi:hypothetical protein
MSAKAGACEACQKGGVQGTSLHHKIPDRFQSTTDGALAPGGPLGEVARPAFLSSGFGHDFSGISIHGEQQKPRPESALDNFTSTLAEHLFQTRHYSNAYSQSAAAVPTVRRLAEGHPGDGSPATTLAEEKLDTAFDSPQAEPSEPGGASPMQSGAIRPGIQTGGTNCDTETGTVVVKVSNTDPCTKDCSLSHEKKHEADIGPCCTKAGNASKKLEKQEDKNAIQDKFNNWMKKENEDFLECRAYPVSVSCAEAKHKRLKCPESSYNDKCCGPLVRFISSASTQRDGACNNAGKKLTDCPFT